MPVYLPRTYGELDEAHALPDGAMLLFGDGWAAVLHPTDGNLERFAPPPGGRVGRVTVADDGLVALTVTGATATFLLDIPRHAWLRMEASPCPWAALAALPGRRFLSAGPGCAAILDAATEQWRRIEPVPADLYTSAVVTSSDDLLLIGGCFPQDQGGGSAIDAVVRLDPGTGTWNTVGHLIEGRAAAGTLRLGDAQVLVVSGCRSCEWCGLSADSNVSSYELLRPDGTRSTSTHLPDSRMGFSLLRLSDGRIVALGGGYADNHESPPAALFSASGGYLGPGPPLLHRRTNFGAVPLADGRVLVFGGIEVRDYQTWPGEVWSDDGPTCPPTSGVSHAFTGATSPPPGL
jgi:hypothetical protein